MASKFVDIYLAELSRPGSIEFMTSRLSSVELERHGKIKSQKRQREFLVSRYLVRQIFAEKYGFSDVRVLQEKSGKPFVDSPLHFNMSHCDGRIAICVSDIGAVGIDIEPFFRKNSFRAIINKYFSSKESAYIFEGQGEAEQQLRFLKAWTMKEAIYKMHSLMFSQENSEIFIDISGQKIEGLPSSVEHLPFELTTFELDSAFLSVSVLRAGQGESETISKVVWNKNKLSFESFSCSVGFKASHPLN